LERLRKDKDFQKYVVDEILRRHITELTDITKIGIIGKDTKIGFEEVGKSVYINILSSEMLRSILAKLVDR